VSGGRIAWNITRAIDLTEQTTGQITGGDFLGDIRARGSSVLSIYGGSFDSSDSSFLALEDSVIIVHGAVFSLPWRSISVLSGTLNGLLADGTPINLLFARASTATIELACPGLGFLAATTPSLAADQDNYCEVDRQNKLRFLHHRY
jgi:hypothetical protein